MNPLVSVIIPSFNSSQYLEDSINSVIFQTYNKWELILVDDGSTDNIDAIIVPFLEKDSRIRYFKKKNGGLGSARNFGILNSTGKYIFPLDADDKIANTLLEKSVSYLENNLLCVIVNCKTEAFGFGNGLLKKREFNLKDLLLSNMIFASAMFRRKDFDQVGGYDETILYEDWDFWLRLLKNGGSVYMIPEILFMYRQHKEGSLMNELKKKGAKHKKSLKTIYTKNVELFFENYGNPIEIELAKQKIERELNHPLHRWVTKNKKSILGRILVKLIK